MIDTTPTHDAPEPLWKYEDVARYARVSRWTIREWVLAGRIPEVRIGRLVRFDPVAVRKALS